MSDEGMSEKRRKEFESDCRRSLREKEWPKHCKGYVPVSMVWECFEEIDRLKTQSKGYVPVSMVWECFEEIDRLKTQLAALERERDALRAELEYIHNEGRDRDDALRSEEKT